MTHDDLVARLRDVAEFAEMVPFVEVSVNLSQGGKGVTLVRSSTFREAADALTPPCKATGEHRWAYLELPEGAASYIDWGSRFCAYPGCGITATEAEKEAGHV